MPTPIRGPALTAIVGPMFSGKSEELIRMIRVHLHANQSVLVVKPSSDTRCGDEITSRNGHRVDAVALEHARDILEYADPYEVIGIDEGQFFDMNDPDALAAVARELMQRGKHVIVAGLDLDYKEQPFENMARLMALAERVVKQHAVCMRCRQYSASRTSRLVETGERLQVGNGESYLALCLTCYYSREENTPST